MPTRSYYFPKDFSHIREILRAEDEFASDKDLALFQSDVIAPIPTTGIFSIILGISPKIIFSIRSRIKQNYRVFEIKKKNGKPRKIESPRTYLKVIQWWILDNILSRVAISDHAFGFAKDRNPYKNAKCHLGMNHILNVDIEDFFPSIKKSTVEQVFIELGYPKDVSEQFADLCCFEDRLPQGAPTSPALANLVCIRLDTVFAEFSARNNLNYSRYADDLTFSSINFISDKILIEIKSIITGFGFKLNKSKTRFSGRGNQMEVTGIIVNEILQPSRTWRKRTRATLHQINKKSRFVRADLNYLHGIAAMRGTFESSVQVQSLSQESMKIIELRRSEVIGIGENPKLPNDLTLRQAEALMHLTNSRSNAEIALILETSEDAIKKRLQIAFEKVGVTNRNDAKRWSDKNL